MMELEPIVLTDPQVQPTDELIFSIIGENKIYWEELVEHIYNQYTFITEEWRFYNDGKSWLYRALKKKNTIYWIGVQKDTFRVSIWLADKAAPVLEASALPESVKEQYRNARQFKIGRCVSIVMRSPEDLECVKLLADIKVNLK
jgi:hypothetical protein